ncbi:RING-14 protein [Sarocladium strictum]
MKFARDFRDALASQGFPEHWVDQAIPYGRLKKCLKKVQRELQELGLDPETLRVLIDPASDSPLALQYQLETSSGTNLVRPKLTVDVHLQDGIVVDASLTPASRRFLEKLASDIAAEKLGKPQVSRRKSSQLPDPESEPDDEPEAAHRRVDDTVTTDAPPGTNCETIEVPLTFDGEFFDLLQNDVVNLDALQEQEQQKMLQEVEDIGKEVAVVAKPSRFSKNDLARWRDIFELYLDAEIFFATHEQDHGARSSGRALKQLQLFQGEVEKRKLNAKFKLRESQVAFDRFLKLNVSLLKNLQFQELNRLAVSKILKKFDKRTALGISKAFPVAVPSDKLLAGSVAKDVCAQMSQQLVNVVPQLNDYLCPVCFAVAYRPVKLDCQHIFCLRCIVKMQRRKEKHCPLCRSDVVMTASADNLDIELAKYLRKYFSKEAKEKQKADDLERGIEDYGPDYRNNDCTIM